MDKARAPKRLVSTLMLPQACVVCAAETIASGYATAMLRFLYAHVLMASFKTSLHLPSRLSSHVPLPQSSPPAARSVLAGCHSLVSRAYV